MKNDIVLYIIAALVIAGGIWLAYTKAGRSYELADLDTRITVPQLLKDLAHQRSDTPEVGPVLAMYVPQASGNCILGIYYKVDKADLAEPKTRWTEELLKSATQGSEGVLPQTKEFDDSYLVFEPSQAACSQTEEQLSREAELREELWRTVGTAKPL